MSLPTSTAATVSGWLLVALCALSGAYCLLRAHRAERAARGAAGGEALMGFGMAAMAAPTGTGAWGSGVLLAVFCAASLHAVWLLRSGVHHVHHLVGSLAMVYMTVTMGAATASGAGGAHAGSHGAGHGAGLAQGLPLVTGALLLYFAGYVLLGGARLVTTAGGPAVALVTGGPLGRGRGAAEVTRACRLAMGMGMLAMLLTM
ncbi:DUF5134 domain-containing protein [Streptomyces sp. NPDC051555]|uniref:DUF5134 domain-containing protein n=1 Tax=Streptomyces sp. NPDC051555 TaxID=3365657 RepID=UPI003790AB84